MLGIFGEEKEREKEAKREKKRQEKEKKRKIEEAFAMLVSRCLKTNLRNRKDPKRFNKLKLFFPADWVTWYSENIAPRNPVLGGVFCAILPPPIVPINWCSIAPL